MNFLPAKVNGAGVAFRSGFSMPMDRNLPSGREVVLGIRPEHLELAAEGFEAEVVVIEPTGSETQLYARVDGQEIAAVFRERHAFSPGTRIRLRPRAECIHLFDPSSGQRI